jgi:nucleotide-binding universal stress UspA family protein
MRPRAGGARDLRSWPRASRPWAGRSRRPTLSPGTPSRVIVTLAEELGAGFVVMGKTGYGGLRRALMGSISDYVVKNSHSPVVVGE